MAKSDRAFEIEIEGMAHGGSGIGRLGRRTVFVPFTIPGERVLIRPVYEAETYILAEGVRLLEASADRVYPVCEAFGARGCVRCSWQHIAYEAQLLLKQDVLTDQLERIGKVSDPPVRAAIPSPEQWGYMSHVTYTVTEDGRLALPAREGRGLVTVDNCALIHPDLFDLYTALDLDFKDISRVRLQRGSDGALMIVFFGAKEEAPELELDLPASVNFILPDNEPMNLVGESHSRFEVGGRLFRATAGSFFRANVPAVRNLAQTVEALLEAREGMRVLDLYAGVGVLSAFLAPHAGLVTLVESYPPAATDADENLADFDNLDIIEGGVEAVLEELDPPYQAAVVDPPHGLTDAIIDRLTALGVKRIAYVSDDPTMLAKDCRRLAKRGYILRAAQPVDLAPQTYYVDTVALFERRS